jgi:hypothetical protein
MMRPQPLTLLLAALLLPTCAGRDIKSAGAEPLVDSNGKKVGEVRRLSATELEYIYDPNSDGRPERRWVSENEQMKVFEKFDATTGVLRTRTYYLNGLVNRVEVYGADGRLRGVVNYPDGKEARSVELPARGKLIEYLPR